MSTIGVYAVGIADPHGGRELCVSHRRTRRSCCPAACRSCRTPVDRPSSAWAPTGAAGQDALHDVDGGQRRTTIEDGDAWDRDGCTPDCRPRRRCSRRSRARSARPRWRCVWMPDAMSSGLISLAPVAKLAIRHGSDRVRSPAGLGRGTGPGHPVDGVDHAVQTDDLRQAGERTVDRVSRSGRRASSTPAGHARR